MNHLRWVTGWVLKAIRKCSESLVTLTHTHTDIPFQGSLSDSLLVNTSFNDPSIKDAIVCKKEEEKEIELGSSKKFKMQIHNDIDS